jgi:O-antigen/teichoic acid export membrane protein
VSTASPSPADRSARHRGSIAGLTLAITLAGPLGLITGPIVARALGAAGRGEVATATVYGNLAWIVLGLGLPWAVGQRVAVEPSSVRPALGSAVRFSLLLAPVAAVAGLLLVVGPLSHLGDAAAAGTFVLVAVAPLNVFSNCQQSILVGEGALGAMSVLRAVPIVLSAVAIVAVAVAGWLGVGTYLIVTIAAGLLVNAATWWYLREPPRGLLPMQPLLSFGLRSAGGQLASFSNRFVDQALLALVVSTRQLGVYAVAATVSSVPLGFGQAIAARSFGEVAKAPEDQRAETATRYLRLALVVGGAAAAAIAVAVPIGLPLLFGRQFRGAVVPTLLLLPGTATLAAGLTGVRVLNAMGRPGRATVAEIGGLAVTLPGLAVAVPLFGIRGAALVSTAAYWTRLGVMLRSLRREGVASIRPGSSDVRDAVRLGWQAARRPLRRLSRRGGLSARG